MSIQITNPPGGDASGTAVAGLFSEHQIPAPATDGAQTVFTTPAAYVAGSLNVYRDQSVMLKGGAYDYEETTDTTFTMASAPDADEVLWCSYIKK